MLVSSVLPITSANFYLFFIALIIVFFLIGFIIGYILNPVRKLQRTEEKPLAEIEPAQDTPTNSIDLGQDIPGRAEAGMEPSAEASAEPRTEQLIQDTENAFLRYNNYNSYWGYIKPPKQH
jgi:hypothetical protein